MRPALQPGRSHDTPVCRPEEHAMAAVQWHSESEEFAIDEEIGFSEKLKDGTLAMIIGGYVQTGERTTTLVFINDDKDKALAAARAWAKFAKKYMAEEEE